MTSTITLNGGCKTSEQIILNQVFIIYTHFTFKDMGHNSMHWKPHFSIIVMPFNSHALLYWFHLIKLLKVFFLVKTQFSTSISIGCHHLLSPCISSFHGLTSHTTWPFNSFFPMWTCAPMFQALSFKVFNFHLHFWSQSMSLSTFI
jgi:hypothetical protein